MLERVSALERKFQLQFQFERGFFSKGHTELRFTNTKYETFRLWYLYYYIYIQFFVSGYR